MHRRRRFAPALVAAVLGGLLTGACSRSGAPPAETKPLDVQLGFDQAGMLDHQAWAENLIRDCMKGQGFDYVPVYPAAQQAALTGVPGMSKADYEKQFGYGITTLYERAHQVGNGANDAIRNSLSESDRRAYDRALHGDDRTATLAQALDSGDFSKLGGCLKQGTEAVFGGAETLTTLQSKLDELDERIAADPRMVKVIANWSGCMRAAGFGGLQNPEAVDSTLQKKLDEIVGAPGGAGSHGNYDKATLAALQREEVQMVAADQMCERKHISAVEGKVAAEYEVRFREENASLLAKLPTK